MACYWLNPNETNIKIPSIVENVGIVYYCICVNVGSIEWTVLHRYNEFYELHQLLVVDHGVSKDILPPKKVINNKCPIFIETRRKALEIYLKSVFNYLQRTLPRVFLKFLDFQEYDVFFLLQKMAFQFFMEGDTLLGTTKQYTLNILQLHAISKCLKGPYPGGVEEIEDKRYDLSHVLDVCSQLHHLHILGNSKTFKNSNFIPNDLTFDLVSFKALQTLQVFHVGLEKLVDLGNLRFILKKLKVCNTATTSISQILMCDYLHKVTETDDCNKIWHELEEMDISFNQINAIDSAICLAPNIRILILSQNKIQDIMNLSSLTKLSELVLSANQITKCDLLHTKLGNVVHIDLSQNAITTLRGFDKLYSLEYLDVSCNQICDIEEIRYVGPLPCLEHLRLTANPVAITVDYRVKVFEHFGPRAAHIYLDNEKATQKEIDTAFILQALRIVKEGKTPNLI